MKSNKMKVIPVFLVISVFAFASSGFSAGAKRCTAEGEKVECPTRTAEELQQAAANYEKEAKDMVKGIGGSTYGIAPFDYLTGVGKRSSTKEASAKTNLAEAGKKASGYAATSGKTEMWSRVSKTGESVDYNAWTNNWSPSFKTSLVPGANPNEGKQWFYVYCVGCHGWRLQGDGPNAMYLDPFPRDLTAGSYMNKKTNLELFTVIKGGGAAVDLSDLMPSWGNLLQDQDIWNVIAWIRANADAKRKIESISDYLNPVSSFDPKSPANKINALNAPDSPEFKEAQDLLESMVAGRGGDLKGGGYVNGGLRKTPAEEAKMFKK